jgi:L-2-hydroxyglutarate oxidase LhgO
VLVVGAGVVGLAIARAAATAGRSVMVLEQHEAIGTETSARNSEVVHAGLYYPTGSLKARLCVQGNALLQAYAASHGVALRAVGKLIVATDERQLPALKALQAQAQANGVPGMQWLNAAQAQALEPQLHCVAALHSASTSIIDSHGLMLALQGDAQAHGANVVCRARVQSAEPTAQSIAVQVQTPDGAVTLHTQWLINCAGLWATQVAHAVVGLPKAHIPPAYYAKGSYYSLLGASPFKRLIYPLPPAPTQPAQRAQSVSSLGVHLTLDLAGQARFGPDIEWLDHATPAQLDYTVDAAKSAAFYSAVRQYWPGLPDGALSPAYSGVRPKMTPPSAAAADFHISSPAQHGVPGVVNLFGIESPGLTSCMALAQYVCRTACGFESDFL